MKAASSYYLTTDDYTLQRCALLEVAWSTFRFGDLHAIELGDGRIIFRYVLRPVFVSNKWTLEIQGKDDDTLSLLPLVLVRRVGAAHLVITKNVVHMGAWLSIHPRPIRNLLFDERGAL
jgi:hypothetical protein